MQLRHVVTSFLRDTDSGRVLLGRRSEEVNTYPGRWAAISGAVEDAAPLQQARREIAEETGLGLDDVRLVAEGLSVRFTAWELATVWVVHPFLFRCLRPDGARPDWEHVEFEWVDPAEIDSLETVPKLAEAFRAVEGFQGRPSPERAFDEVRDDRERGADELGLLVLEAIQAAATAATDSSDDDWLAHMKALCREAATLRPSMASVRSAALEAFGVCREALEDSPEDTAQGASDAIEALISGREQASIEAAAAAAGRIEDGARVATLSYSSTVLMALRDSADRIAELTVAESRPRCEGRETARIAATFGIRTRLLTDGAAASALGGVDLLLFGADSITGQGDVVNKTGTLALCLAAQRFGGKTLCVSTPAKVLPECEEPALERMDPEELGEPMDGVEVENRYFEVIPAGLVDALVLGEDAAETGLPAQRAARLASLEGDLDA